MTMVGLMVESDITCVPFINESGTGRLADSVVTRGPGGAGEARVWGRDEM